MTSPPAYQKPRDDLPTIIRWARILLTLALVPLGLRVFRDAEAYVPLVSDINVAVHEFGHMLFMPFGVPILGETLVILGGSLFQIAFPLVFVGYFLFSRQHRDVHAAMVCLWWTAVNVVHVALYVADARARELTLISGLTGQEDDGHDWYNLLAQWGALNHDLIYAGRLRALAGLLFLIAILVGLWAAWWSGRQPEAGGPNGTNPASAT